MKRLLMIGLIPLIVLCTASYTPAQRNSYGTVTSLQPERHCGIIRSSGRDYYFNFKDVQEWAAAVNMKVGSALCV
jgi:hypothetical protein